jgi:predicted nucleic acid-binding protein
MTCFVKRRGFSADGTPLIIDSNSMRAGMADALRARGYNVRAVSEIFGTDPGDPAIAALAEKLGGKVLTNNMQDFGRNIVIRIDPRATSLDTWIRLIGNGLK